MTWYISNITRLFEKYCILREGTQSINFYSSEICREKMVCWLDFNANVTTSPSVNTVYYYLVPWETKNSSYTMLAKSLRFVYMNDFYQAENCEISLLDHFT